MDIRDLRAYTGPVALADRIGLPIDARRQIDPVLHAAAETLHRLIKIATVLAHRLPRHAKAKATSEASSNAIARM